MNTKLLTIMDIGARGGMDQILPHWIRKRDLRNYAQHFRLIGIEPETKAAEQLRRLGHYDSVWPIAISGSDGERTLFVTESPDKSSILEPDLDCLLNSATLENVGGYRIASTQKIETLCIDTLCHNENIEYDWLKVDTQGSEHETIIGAQETIKNATVILLELSSTPQYRGQKLTSETLDYLSSLGFDMCIVNFKPQMPCENDIIFVRSMKHLETFRDFLSIGILFSLFYMNDAKKFLLDQIASTRISPYEISRIRALLDACEKHSEVKPSARIYFREIKRRIANLKLKFRV